MKNVRRWLFAAFLCLSIWLTGTEEAQAGDADENISVTVPANVQVTFLEDGTNSVSSYSITNESLVPIHITNMKITEYNGWQLVSNDTLITVDSKCLVFKMEGQCLYKGNNEVAITVPETSVKKLEIDVRRGAWTYDAASEEALSLEVEYKVGTKTFQLTLDGNGSDVAMSPITAKNGESVTLPTPAKLKYIFQGWLDEDGILHNGDFVMPIGGTILVAQWQKTEAYAIFCAEEQSLIFVRSATPLVAGEMYQGKTMTEVYTGFEDNTYENSASVPWNTTESVYGVKATRVVVQDFIQPKSISFWFFGMGDISYLDLTKLDVSQVQYMLATFSSTGTNVTETVTVKGLGAWKTSNVVNMSSAFRGLAENASVLDMEDISGWDTSNVTNMSTMFAHTAKKSDWSLDCSKWNVEKVRLYSLFHYDVENKVTAPKWVH